VNIRGVKSSCVVSRISSSVTEMPRAWQAWLGLLAAAMLPGAAAAQNAGDVIHFRDGDLQQAVDSAPSNAVVQFDPAAEPGDACSDGTNYICHVPFTSSSLDFSTVESAVSCDLGTGICTVNFINFNFATLGAGPIVFAATTPFGIDTTTPFIPSVAINGGSNASVPEPSSLWFAAIAVLACLGLGWRQQSLRLSAAN